LRTKDALAQFKFGFSDLKEELDLDINMIKNKLKKDFERNYLDQVNYNIPNAKQRKQTEQYLPKDMSALYAQYIFITDNKAPLGEKNKLTSNDKYNSIYMKAHKKYHQSFDVILNKYGLYDIFLVDLEGNLIYTDFKEKDFATNLKTGVYRDTGIARVYNKALTLQEGEVAFDDFAPYEPSYNSPASFIATPIYEFGSIAGVLIFQMPVDTLNQMMSFNGKYEEAGMGESGEIYLIGTDYKMRNNSRFTKDIDSDIVQQLKSTIGVFEVKSDSTKAVIESNQKGSWVIDDYRGVSVLSVYDSIDIYNQTKWAIISEIDEAEAISRPL